MQLWYQWLFQNRGVCQIDSKIPAFALFHLLHNRCGGAFKLCHSRLQNVEKPPFPDDLILYLRFFLCSCKRASSLVFLNKA